MLGDLLTAGLSGLLFGVPVLFIGYMLFAHIAEAAVRMVTEGDHKETFFEKERYDIYTFKFFGKKVFTVGFLTTMLGGMFGTMFSIMFFALSAEYMINNPTAMFMVNPFTEVVSVIFGLVLVVYSNLLFAKYTYKVTKKVGQLKDSLKKHMADKDAHQ